MLYNKNQVRIANDKKKLVKKGKNWIVASAFVLALAAGGYTVAGQVNADTATKPQAQAVTTTPQESSVGQNDDNPNAHINNNIQTGATGNPKSNGISKNMAKQMKLEDVQGSNVPSAKSSSNNTFNVTITNPESYVVYVSGSDGKTIQDPKNVHNVTNITYAPVTLTNNASGEIPLSAYTTFFNMQSNNKDSDVTSNETQAQLANQFGYKIINPYMIATVNQDHSISLKPDIHHPYDNTHENGLHAVDYNQPWYNNHFILESMPSAPVYIRLQNVDKGQQVNVPGTGGLLRLNTIGNVGDKFTIDPKTVLSGSHALPPFITLTKDYQVPRSYIHKPNNEQDSHQQIIQFNVQYNQNYAKPVSVPFYSVRLDNNGNIMSNTLKPGLFPPDYSGLYNNTLYMGQSNPVNIDIDSQHINDYDNAHPTTRILPDPNVTVISKTNQLNVQVLATDLTPNSHWYNLQDSDHYNHYNSDWHGQITPNSINTNGYWTNHTPGSNDNEGIPEYNGRVVIEYVENESPDLSLYNVTYNYKNYAYYNNKFYPYNQVTNNIPPYVKKDGHDVPNFKFIKDNHDGTYSYINYPSKLFANWGSEAIVQNPYYTDSGPSKYEWKSDSKYFLIKFTSNKDNPVAPSLVPVNISNDSNGTITIQSEPTTQGNVNYQNDNDIQSIPNYDNVQVHVELPKQDYYFYFVKSMDPNGTKYYVDKFGNDIGSNPNFNDPKNRVKIHTFSGSWFSTPYSPSDNGDINNSKFREVYSIPNSALNNVLIKEFSLPNGYDLNTTAQNYNPYSLNLIPNSAPRTDIFVQGAPVHFIFEVDGYPVHVDGHTGDDTTAGTIEPNNQMSGHKTISAQVTLPLEIRQLDNKGNVMNTQSTSITTWTDFRTPHTYTLPESLASYANNNWSGYKLISPKTINYIISNNNTQLPIVWDYVPDNSNNVRHSVLPQINVVDRYMDVNGHWHNINGVQGVPVTLQLNSNQLTSNPFTINPSKTLINGSQTLNQTQGSQYKFDSSASDPMDIMTTNATPGYKWTNGKVPTEYYDLQQGLIDIRYVNKYTNKVVGDQIPQMGPVNSSFTLDPQYYTTETYGSKKSDPIPEGYVYANSYTAPSTYGKDPQIANIYVTPIDSDIFVNHNNDSGINTNNPIFPGTSNKWPISQSDLTKTVTRNINYVDSNDINVKVAPSQKQSITYNRTAVVDKDSGQLLGYSTNGTVNIPANDGDEAWEPSQYQTLPSVTSPVIKGYYLNQPNQSVVSAEDITPNTTPSSKTVNVEYQKLGLIMVHYRNKINDKIVKNVPMYGTIGTNTIIQKINDKNTVIQNSNNNSDEFNTGNLLNDLPTGYEYAGMRNSNVNQFEPYKQTVDVLLTKRPTPKVAKSTITVDYVNKASGSVIGKAGSDTEDVSTPFDIGNYLNNLPSGYEYAGVKNANSNDDNDDFNGTEFDYKDHTINVLLVKIPQGTINVNYVDKSNNRVLAQAEPVTNQVGHPFDISNYLKENDLPSGYEYAGMTGDTNYFESSNHTINILLIKVPTPNIAKSTITINYLDKETGKAVIPSKSDTENVSTDFDIDNYLSNLPSGYEYTGIKSANSNDDFNGTEFDYNNHTIDVLLTKAPVPKVAKSTITVDYVNKASGSVIGKAGSDTEDITTPFDIGQYLSNLPKGYEYAGIKGDVDSFDYDNHTVSILLIKAPKFIPANSNAKPVKPQSAKSNGNSKASAKSKPTSKSSAKVVPNSASGAPDSSAIPANEPSSSASNNASTNSSISSASMPSSASSVSASSATSSMNSSKASNTSSSTSNGKRSRNRAAMLKEQANNRYSRYEQREQKVGRRVYLDNLMSTNRSFKFGDHRFMNLRHSKRLPQTGESMTYSSAWAAALMGLSAVMAGLGHAVGFKKRHE